MTKISQTLWLFIALATTFCFEAAAQMGNVTKAEQFTAQGKLDKALDMIQAATTHEKSKDNPKTWYVRAELMISILADDSTAMGKLVDNPTQEALNSMKKVEELEKAEGKDKYTVMLDNSIPGLTISPRERLKNTLINKGVTAYNGEDMPKAAEALAQAADLFPQDTLCVLYAAYFAESADKPKEAAEYYYKLTKIEEYPNPKDAYIKTIQMRQEAKLDEGQTLAVVREAMQKYPKELFFITYLINQNMKEGKIEESISLLEEAVAVEPDISFLVNLGVLYTENKQQDKALATFKKAVEVDPKNFEANYSLGAYYYTQGQNIYANLTDAQYKDANNPQVKEMIAFFNQSLPYMEKAFESRNDDLQTVGALATLYKELKQDDKAKKMQARFKILSEATE
ncbi:tetratricopeptide repeat protein [Hugenholtzia roseola]|uniref:tetratricopeptide repeat protein n=1 Tax=Hugenholtzia roseola TaxID=1002 RepID=UPI0004209E49|nr:tetratricopeptide repeat protein [Hugenholtzia roseola]